MPFADNYNNNRNSGIPVVVARVGAKMSVRLEFEHYHTRGHIQKQMINFSKSSHVMHINRKLQAINK